jgi:hypothetical protein
MVVVTAERNHLEMTGKGTSLSIKVVVIRSIGNQETPVAMTISREEKAQGGLGRPPHLMSGTEIVIAETSERVSTTGLPPQGRRRLHLAHRCQLGG